MSVRVRPLAVAVVAGVVAVGGVHAEAGQPGPAPRPGQAAPPGRAAEVLAGLTPGQRVGQLLMVGGPATGVSLATKRVMAEHHVGNAMLTGRSHYGISSTAAVSRDLQRLTTSTATGGVRLFVATDQEGGLVQVLHDGGFSDIPTALVQGRLSASVLRQNAAVWGRQLRLAGVNVNLAPVLDTVPSAAFAPDNPPIGALDREYGFTPEWVGSRGTAFAQGMRAAGVEAAIKHFPGLGRVTANTDTTTGVTDRTTGPADPYLRPFAQAISAGAPFVMVSSAYYSRIDSRTPAAFSRTVIRGMLRTDRQFTGVVMSDDLGNAAQVRPWAPGERAVRFVAAGGDLILTVNPATIPAMYVAVLRQAQADPAFRQLVDEAALRVLTRKEAQGLLPAR